MEIIQMELSIRDRKIIVDDDMGDKIKEHTWYIQEFPKSETLVITTRIDRKIVRLENFIYGEKGVSQIKKNNDYLILLPTSNTPELNEKVQRLSTKASAFIRQQRDIKHESQ